MAKGLPYFKFTPTEWLTGDICCEDFEVQGLFINICALYWQRDGILSVEDINKRYKKPTAFDSLIDRFISVNDGLITIDFLKEQLEERGHKSVVNSTNGKLGGRPKTKATKPNANRTLTETKANESQQEEEEDKEEEKEIILSEFEKTFEDFRSMRNKIRKPMTPKAEELLLIKLQKMCGGNELLKIKLLNQSIINCWQDIYDIKIEKKVNTGGDINGVNIDNIKY